MMPRNHFSLFTLASVLTASLPVAAEPNKQPEDNQSNSATPEAIEEMVVWGSRRGNFTEITQEAQKLVDMPGAFGDPLGAIFSLPGVVHSDGEGGSPAVRGSSPDDNIFLVDFLPAGYIFHEFSTSIFHESIIQDFKMHSAGFGPEYGNVTGAVFDITLREPKQQDLEAIVDLSMLRSGIFLESEVSENSAFYLSARKSLMHHFIDEGKEDKDDGITIEKAPEDEDYQFKYLLNINDNNKLTLSANGATDIAAAKFSRKSEFVRSNPDFKGNSKLKNQYHGYNLSWDSYGKTGRHFKLAAGNLSDKSHLLWGNGFFDNTELRQKTIKSQLVFPTGNKHQFTLGASINKYDFIYQYDIINFVCTEFDSDCETSRRGRIRDKKSLDQTEKMFFINDSWSLTNNLEINIGVQHQRNNYTKESFTHPRLGVYYSISDNKAITFNAGGYNRFPDVDNVLPQVGNPNLNSPTAKHYTIGFEHELNHDWKWTIEGYYKEIDDLPLAIAETAKDADLLYSNDVSGRAYGVDLFFNKELSNDWYTWIAFSYAKSERTNERTHETRDYYLDTPLIFNWALNYQYSKDFNISWRWTVRSGAAYTPIVGLKENPYFSSAVLPAYGDPYSKRLPTYSRFDLRMKWDFTLAGYDGEYVIDILNLFNQKNVTDRALDYDKINNITDPLATEDTIGNGIFPYLGLKIYL